MKKLSTSCEVRRGNGWTAEEVANLLATERHEIRCMHCHGRVRIHRRHVLHGPQDHVEHRSRQDSEYCPAGHHFQGEHRLSANPVL